MPFSNLLLSLTACQVLKKHKADSQTYLLTHELFQYIAAAGLSIDHHLGKDRLCKAALSTLDLLRRRQIKFPTSLIALPVLWISSSVSAGV